jgi:hypothetical protein
LTLIKVIKHIFGPVFNNSLVVAICSLNDFVKVFFYIVNRVALLVLSIHGLVVNLGSASVLYLGAVNVAPRRFERLLFYSVKR